MRLQIFLISLLSLCFAIQAQEDTAIPDNIGLPEGNWISLEGNNTIKMPSVSFVGPEANWTYPFPFFPVYAENQSISGSFLGQSGLADSEMKACISSFHMLDLLGQSRARANAGCSSPTRLNDTGDGRFSLEGITSGLYTITVMDAVSSAVFAATPVLVVKREIEVNLSPQVTAGDVLEVNMKTRSSKDNETMFYGAIMVSSEDYGTARLNIASNGTEESILSTIAIGNRSMQVQGMPAVSMDLLMRMLDILPQNSAVAMQESAGKSVDLYLFTDQDWAKGEYILTCAAYSPKNGLMSLRQKTVEMA